MTGHKITCEDVKWARERFQMNEPRDLFYRAASVLIELALKGESSLTVAEALAVLLQTWNKAYYRFHKFDAAHFGSIDQLLSDRKAMLNDYRNLDIADLDDLQKGEIFELFTAFEAVLGKVGAAKALHLLAPKFFPLWDDKISREYRVKPDSHRTNAERYWLFMLITRGQCRDLKGEDPDCKYPLKSIDEYNYCKYTKGWV